MYSNSTPPEESDIETLLRQLALPEMNSRQGTRLEACLITEYSSRKNRKKYIVLALAAAFIAVLGSLTLLAPGTTQAETSSRLVRITPLGKRNEGQAYNLLYENTVSIPTGKNAKVVVTVPEEKTVIVSDDVI